MASEPTRTSPGSGEPGRLSELGTKKLSPMAGVLLLWGLGVGYVISGDYYGWNFGLTATGYWGFLIALGFAGVLYACMVGVIAELASAIPHSGGPYAFCRTALGPLGGYIAGIGVLIEYVVAPAAVATAIGAYINVLVPGIPVLVSASAVYILFTAIHLWGVGASLKIELVFTLIAVAMLIVFFVVSIPNITMDNLNQVGGGEILPNGFGGLWAALPLAAWFFLAIEGLPMAAEESRNPEKDIPRALVLSFVTLAVLAVLTLTVAAGLGGAQVVGEADSPLPIAVKAGLGDGHWLVGVISVVGLAGLAASFHGIVLAYSRQIFALARTGYLPSVLASVNSHRTPTWALIVPGIIGIILVAVGQMVGNAIAILVTMSVFGAAVSYIMMMVAAIVLRRRRPDLKRPFKVPGGQATAWVALVLAAILLPAGTWQFPEAWFLALLTFAAFAAYYLLYSRRKLVSQSVEEELSVIQQAESQLR